MKILRIILDVFGALALIALALIGYAIWDEWIRGPVAIAKSDVRVVLNMASVPADAKYHVIDSSRSNRSMGGDHADFACVQMEKLDFLGERWTPTPESDAIFVEALAYAYSFPDFANATCLPPLDRLKASGFRLLFRSVVTNERYPSDVDVYIADPATNRLYYLSVAT